MSDEGGGILLNATLVELDSNVLEPAFHRQRQQDSEFAEVLHASARNAVLSAEQEDVAFRAHVAACIQPGAGVWLTAPPAQDGRELEAPLFKLVLRRRLHMPVAKADGLCPCCGSCMDEFGDRASVC